MDKKEIREYVKANIKRFGKHYSWVYYRCIYNGVEYQSATMYPKTAVNLLTNKIYFHTVIKQTTCK